MIKIIFYILFAFFVCFLIITLADIASALNNTKEYERVYHIGNSDHSQFKSIGTYVIWRIVEGALIIPLIFILFMKILGKKISPSMKILGYIIFFGFVLWWGYYYWMW